MRLNVPVSQVDLYPINEERGIWSFRQQPGTLPTRVRVPKGTIPRWVGSILGIELSIPSKDPCVRFMWSANQVWRAVDAKDKRFKRIVTDLAVA